MSIQVFQISEADQLATICLVANVALLSGVLATPLSRSFPKPKLEGDIFVGIGASIAASFGDNADGSRRFDPLFWGQGKTIEASLFFKPVEFDGFKIRVVSSS
jgi:hypothetical protein